MTKADLVVDVMRLGDLTRTDAETIIETIFDSVVAALRSGDKIEIRGFGSFRTRQRNPRIGRNPKTGARVEVPVETGTLLQAQQGFARPGKPPGKRRSESGSACFGTAESAATP